MAQAWDFRTLPKLDESVVTPGFAYNLARYFPSGTHHDKEKCIEIMEKIGVSSDPATWYSTGTRARTPARPRSVPLRSVRSPENRKHSYTKNPELFYMTTNKREFGGTFGPPAGNARPDTSKIFPSRENKNLSTYQTDFNDKNVRKARAIRAGSAFGDKRNNPHPSEAFMIWKFPSRLPPVHMEEINPETMQELEQGQLKSTYQSDYTGIPQGVNISTVFEGDLVPALYKPPYTLDSTTRYTYQTPAVKSELAGNLTRFGCNKNKYKPAVGAVPTVSYNSPQMHLYGRTHYSRDYVDKSAVLKEGSRKFQYGPIPTLDEYLKTAKPHERESLLRKIQSIAVKDKQENRDPEWLSQWTGPA
ncbi:uncharacterized protein LOC110066695 isoform X2 [Orbicella faveolata]|uniref:uncharacterized protein LOC110066695 isoform X2 n=1 Tax=Orbicella faveolata TaxID=48498 RepID=UPI0009E45E48|nr:uncharacterized protein LOC110066695 isoform X2 [Orbicella faveolata]